MSRSDARSRQLRRRPSRVVPASIVAGIIAGIGVLAAMAAIARLVNGTWPSQASSAARAVAGATWGSPVVWAVAVVMAVAGLVLLIAAWKPGHHTAARLTGPDQDGQDGGIADTDYVISRRSLARLAGARADDVDGVDSVSTSATDRQVRLQVTTSSEQTTEVRDRVVHTVTDALHDAGLTPMPRVNARVRTKEI